MADRTVKVSLLRHRLALTAAEDNLHNAQTNARGAFRRYLRIHLTSDITPIHDAIVDRVRELGPLFPDGHRDDEAATIMGLSDEWAELKQLHTDWRDLHRLLSDARARTYLPGSGRRGQYESIEWEFADVTRAAQYRLLPSVMQAVRRMQHADPQLLTVADIDNLRERAPSPPIKDARRDHEDRVAMDREAKAWSDAARDRASRQYTATKMQQHAAALAARSAARAERIEHLRSQR